VNPDDTLHFSGIQPQVLQSPGQAVRHLRRKQSGGQLGRAFGENVSFIFLKLGISKPQGPVTMQVIQEQWGTVGVCCAHSFMGLILP